VEFLMDRHKNYFFMEMNTRIQVEHPVTELITGYDLIREMIRIAQGEEISFSQKDVKIRGHSIECRINAEDPWNNFMPHPGLVRDIRLPDGYGVRVDTAVFPGYTIPRQYDSMIAKLIVHDESRELAIRKMIRCLGEMKIDGVRTTAGFHLAMMRHPLFVKGDFDTGFIEREFENLKPAKVGRSEEIALAVAIQSFVVSNLRTMQDRTVTSPEPRGDADPWVMAGRYRRFLSRNI
jgi:acetyl-CoA carboxylase biotin carboxylase subunit